MADQKWVDVGSASELTSEPVTRVEAGGLVLALSFADGTFAALALPRACTKAVLSTRGRSKMAAPSARGTSGRTTG